MVEKLHLGGQTRENCSETTGERQRTLGFDIKKIDTKNKARTKQLNAVAQVLRSSHLQKRNH
jgi:hypothetical protein